MNQLTRRALFYACGAVLTSAAVTGSAHATAAAGGCLLCREARRLQQPGALGMVANPDGGTRIYTSCGDAQTDRYLGLALKRLAETFRVAPGFAFFDDERGSNAFATNRTLLDDGQHTVLMGKRLFAEQMRQDNDLGTTVIAICAHEFGHIYQMTYGEHARLAEMDATVRPLELHADFLAGYYLNLRHNDHADLNLPAVGQAFYNMGDTDYNAPAHHGTPQERIRAISAGYAFGHDQAGDIDSASRAATALVRQML